MIRTGSSYCSQSELPLTFGLGKPEAGAEAITLTLEITWPGGTREIVKDVKSNQAITVQEGKGIVSTQAIVFVRSAPQPSPPAENNPQLDRKTHVR